MIQEAHHPYCHVPNQQQSLTLKSCHGQVNTLATLRGFRQKMYCKSKRKRTWVLLTELVTTTLYDALAMKVSQSNHYYNARFIFSQKDKEQAPNHLMEQLTNTSLGEDGCTYSPWWSSLKSVLSSSLMPLLRSCTRKRRLSKTGRFLLAKKGTNSLACQWTLNCCTLKCARNC